MQVARLERSRVAAWQRLVAVLLQTYGVGGDLEHVGGAQLAPLVQLSGAYAVLVRIVPVYGWGIQAYGKAVLLRCVP